jgi:hypothetical protein
MKLRIKKQGLGTIATGLLLFGVFTFLLFGVGITSYTVFGVNITNLTVLAKVNVTNTQPNITNIVIDDGTPVPARQIDLTPNGITNVVCNATVFDYNGAADVQGGNATLFVSSVGSSAADDNNHHYTNNSCACTSSGAPSGTEAYCLCTFPMQYYANSSSSWVCNMTVYDNGGTAIPSRKIRLNDTDSSTTFGNDVLVNKLLAINTTNLLIDYQNLSVTETSDEIPFNVTNGGNTGFNLSLRGYGGTNESIGQNLSMICDFGNITIGYQRYALGSEFLGATSYNSMTILRNTTNITGFTLPQRTDDVTYGADRNSTFWRLQVPLSVGGICNGTIIFGAIETYS